MTCGERLHELHVAVLRGRGRIENGVLRRKAEHHRDVAELEVTVDEHHRIVERFAIATATLIAMQVLPTPPFGREHDDQTAGLATPRRRRLRAAA